MYHRRGRLFQHYIVDGAAQVEDSKLAYQCNNQSDFRVALYSGLDDALRVGDNPGDVGRRVVLASTFVGGPRYNVQQYQDAMAIVRKLDKPDLFVTFTCNPGMLILLQLKTSRHPPASPAVRRALLFVAVAISAVPLRLPFSFRPPPFRPRPA